MQNKEITETGLATDRTQRDWGHYDVLHVSKDATVKVKQLTIAPCKSINLQFYYGRDEHWFIESGTALVECGDIHTELGPGQYIEISKMVQHRVTNITLPNAPLSLIEIQVGEIVDEQGIIRITETGS
jgi:mannose-6-phosphate isomerase-like protein (cupin superfamily)